MPFADEILFERSISGMLPNLAGPKSAAWQPMRRNDRKHCIHMADYDGREDHERDFGDLAPNDHAALAEAIGEVTGRRGQEQIREHQTGRADREHGADLRWGNNLLADTDNEPAENIVVGRAEELGEHEADERRRQEPIARRMRSRRRRNVTPL